MAYGVTSTTFLLSTGVPATAAAASVHIAEIFTTGFSGLSHWKLGNVTPGLFKRLVIPGVIGAVVGQRGRVSKFAARSSILRFDVSRPLQA